MSRLDRAAISAALSERLQASPDPEGIADLVASGGRFHGRINIAASAAELKPAIDRLKPLDGYRWVAVNPADLFSASPMTIGTKIGIVDPSGRILKAADLPRQT